MKKLYIFTLLLVTHLILGQTPTGTSEEVGITEGQLAVSLTGGASYIIPIAVPPGINGVVPQVSLVYNSQSGNGMAGYGWNISGVSAITRIPRTMFHDGVAGGVNLDTNDRFALDGQRLILKSGTAYGASGAIYETESFSNIKITSMGVHTAGAKYGPLYFKVEHPDGSVAFFGNSTDSRSISAWGITYWENAQKVRISYTYLETNDNLNIDTINYGTTGIVVPINQIKFVYPDRARPEQACAGGQSFITSNILSEIQVFSSGTGFRIYQLQHKETSLGYQLLEKITEISGEDNNKRYNPTVFSYETTTGTVADTNPYNLIPDSIYKTDTTAGSIVGDFDGDGKLNLVMYSKVLTDPWYKKDVSFFRDFSDTASNPSYNIPIGNFEEIFASSFLNDTSKFTPFQGITYIKNKTVDNSTSFVTISADVLYYHMPNVKSEKNVKFPDVVPRQYLNGDFNGDGLTDVIAIDAAWSVRPSMATYFIDLDSRKPTNSMNYAGEIQKNPTEFGTKLLTGDFNGDGKTDIFYFSQYYLKVYGLNNSNNLYLLYQSLYDAEMNAYESVLMGDYNGDGKTDFMIPRDSGVTGTMKWTKYVSTGSDFIKTTKEYSGLNYTKSQYNNQYYYIKYIATDYNNDGKTDIMVVKTTGGYNYLNVYPSESAVFCFINMGDSFIKQNIYLGSYPETKLTPNSIPIFLTAKHSKQSQQIAVINENKIYPFQTLNDFSKERLLQTITTGNGVKETITYSPVEKDACVSNCQSVYTATEGIEKYPNMDIRNASGFRVVSMLEKQSATVYKKQLFQYAGAVSNFEGLGFRGFRATLRTNWHNDPSQIISTVTKSDISLRGAIIESFSVLGMSTPTTILAPTDLFISKSTNTYNIVNGIFENPVQASKVFKLKVTNTKQVNGLEGTSTETTIDYDTYNNPLTTIALVKENTTTVPVQTTTTTTVYGPLSTAPLIIGRPASKETITDVPGDIMKTNEVYTFSRNLLTKIVKNATANGVTTGNITESNVYDIFGNIIQKSISAVGVSTRVTKYAYDPAAPYYGRFLTKSTDVEKFDTTYEYNPSGTLKTKVVRTEINTALPTAGSSLTTSYEYDHWFRKFKTTDYLGKSNTYTYERKDNINTIVKTTGDDGSYSEELYDDLERKIRTGVKDVQDKMSYKDFKYDIYDRNFSTSEPYSAVSPPSQGAGTLWNTTTYEVYGRPETLTDFRGKVMSIAYDKLTTTVTDVSTTTTKKSTKSATGNVVQMEETPGGIIKYTYFANGNIKETDYADSKIKITQDGWGRKQTLKDPSAGDYSYTYNELGEMKTETTPNGTTTYTLNAWGKPSKKTILSLATAPLTTNSNTLYTFDTTKSKLLTKTVFTDGIDANKKITTEYFYDTLKRLEKTIETTGYGAIFTKTFTYDDWGRIDTETSEASLNGKSSKTVIQNEYKNGFAYKVKDIQNPTTLWVTNEVNARGQLIKAQLGNGIEINNTYDPSGFGYLTTSKHTSTTITDPVMELTNDFDPQRGNLNWRTNSLFGSKKEEFDYDDQDRLIKYPNALGTLVEQTYEDDGRIKKNTVGNYFYKNNDKKYQNTSIELNPETTGYYINREGIFSDSMEEKKGWAIPDPAFFTYDTTEKHSGATSLKITNTSSSEKIIHSDVWTKIDNTTDTEYSYSAWVKSTNPEVQLFLFMKSETELGYFTLNDFRVTNVKNEWTRIEGKFLVPAYIKKLNLRLDNNGSGTVWFDDVMIQKTTLTPLANLQVPREEPYKDRQLGITYNTFKAPIEITEAGVDKLSFVYNDNNDRSVMFYGSLDATKTARPYRKYYSADGTMEIKATFAPGNTTTPITVEFVTYLGGDGYSAPVVSKKTFDTTGNAKEQMLYLHRDYQGSILAITDQNAVVLEKRQFDAWGSLIQLEQNGVLTHLPAGGIRCGIVLLLDRGYTGHEHLESVGLINMNGRLYDPKLHRFLQPDNYVQDPSNTQNYNRYGYCLNNPLKYTDPSGEKWKIGWKDVVAGLQVVVGAALLFVPGAQLIGGGLLLNGLSYFASTYEQYKVTGDWGRASANSSIMFGYQTSTDWGYDGTNDVNGVTQNNNSNPLNILNDNPNPTKPIKDNTETLVYSAADLKVLRSMGAQRASIFNNFSTELHISKKTYNVLVGPVTPIDCLTAEELGWLLDTDALGRGLNVFGFANGAKTEIIDYAVRTGSSQAGIRAELQTLGRFGTRYLHAAKGLGKLAGFAGIATTGIDAYQKGQWKNHHTADVLIGVGTTIMLSGPWGWAAGGAYFVADLGWKSYSGQTITESLFD